MILSNQSLLHLRKLPDIFLKPVIFAPAALLENIFEWTIGLFTDNLRAASLLRNFQLRLHFDSVGKLG